MPVPTKIYLSNKIYNRFVWGRDHHAGSDNSNLYMLGKNANGVCVERVKLTRDPGGCSFMQSVKAEHMAEAYIKIARKGLVPGGFGWVNRKVFSGDIFQRETNPPWFGDGGNDIRAQAGVVFVQFGTEMKAEVYDKTRQKRGVRKVEIIIVPEDFNPKRRERKGK